MRTLPATALRTLVVSAALALAVPAVAIETLVNSDGSPEVLSSLERGQLPFNPAIEEVLRFPHYTGTVNGSDAVRERAFSLTLPDTGETLTFEGLELEEIEGGYALTTPIDGDGPVLELVIMGTTVTGTVRIGSDDLYVITPLGNGNAIVHRQDPEEGQALPHHHHRQDELLNLNRESRVLQAPAADSPFSKARSTTPATKSTAPVVDVLFVYNEQALAHAGNITARVALYLLKVNQSFARSDIATRIRSVALHKTAYLSQSDLSSLPSPQAGHHPQ